MLLVSCTQEPLTHSFGLSVAYPPYACTGLEPSYVEINIDGDLYVLEIDEVSGGFVTNKGIELEYGTYVVESMEVYNKYGVVTHFTPKEIGGLGVIVPPFNLKVSDKLPWISGQMFCF